MYVYARWRARGVAGTMLNERDMLVLQDPSASLPVRARVLMVDDQESFRTLIGSLVEATPTMDLVAEADSGEGAVAAAREVAPDMVVMDVVMPGIGGIEAARRIKAEQPATVVVLVSTTHPEDLPREAADSRADEIVWKPDLRPSLLESIWGRYAPDSR
jgi:two-component system, NarL family, invasion response regulator UvrY